MGVLLLALLRMKRKQKLMLFSRKIFEEQIFEYTHSVLGIVHYYEHFIYSSIFYSSKVFGVDVTLLKQRRHVDFRKCK